MRDLKRGHIFGAGLDRWIESNCGVGLEDDDEGRCSVCGSYFIGENPSSVICEDCIEAMAVPEGDDGR